MDVFTLVLFCALLMICVVLNIETILALIGGLIIFCVYARLKKFTWKELFDMIFSGVKTIKNILITFILIGMLTGLWRSGGTIPVIICYAVKLIRPEIFILLTFLLNCGVSVLTGTSFGTVATMGVICMTIGTTMQMHPVWVAGAIMSGIYFGDRCSPVSTSALLVSELTHTDIFSNIKKMIKTSMVPFVITCIIYIVMGLLSNSGSYDMDLGLLFGQEFKLHWVAVIPAVMILVLSAFRVNVKVTMTISNIIAFVLCVLLQRQGVWETIEVMITGYTSSNAEIAVMLNGGGVVSMIKVLCMVSLSSAYAGIFEKTGLLHSIKGLVQKLGDQISPYGALLCTSIVASMIACSQTLAIMLGHQLCGDLDSNENTAINLENTAVLVAPVIPWSVAAAVPLASLGAENNALWAACFLYMVPIWQFIVHFIKHRKNGCK